MEVQSSARVLNSIFGVFDQTKGCKGHTTVGFDWLDLVQSDWLDPLIQSVLKLWDSLDHEISDNYLVDCDVIC